MSCLYHIHGLSELPSFNPRRGNRQASRPKRRECEAPPSHYHGATGEDAEGPFRLVELTQGRFAKVDPDMFDFVNQWAWRCTTAGYASRTSRNLFMHRVINKTPDDKVVDYINGCPLDNRTKNLRACATSENTKNTKLHRDSKSGAKGVSWFKRDQCWRAYIARDYKQIHLGYFQDFEAAKAAYEKAAPLFHGNFHRLK